MEAREYNQLKSEINSLNVVGMDEINQSKELTLSLLRVYSRLYLGSKQPSGCSSCMNDAYKKIRQTGLKILEQMAKKTCKLKGLVHLRTLGLHVSDAGITDEKAIEYLNAKVLQERHFDILPKGYKTEVVEIVEEVVETVAVKDLELTEEFKGQFTTDNLTPMNGNKLIGFAEKVTGDNQENKKAAILAILDWQK